MWICKQCSSEVDDNFDVCWNCNYDKNGRFITWDTGQKNEEEVKTTIPETDKIIIPSNLVINPARIVAAGKSIKGILRIVLIMMAFNLIAGIALFLIKDSDLIDMIYVIMAFASLIWIIKILIRIYSAGNNLEKAVSEK